MSERKAETVMVTKVEIIEWDQVGVDDGSVKVTMESQDATVTVAFKYGNEWGTEIPWKVGELFTIDWFRGTIS